jgi:hypothetical protein
VPRGRISPADQALIAELDERGLPVTRYQLERWRQRGLLPRPLVSHHARGTQTELTADSVEIATALADFSRRGRDWQQSVIWLYEWGYVSSEPALRETALWIVAQSENALTRAAQAMKELPSSDDLEAVEAFVEKLAKRRSGRPLRRSLLEVIRSRHPHLSQRELRERADTAELWSTYFQLHPNAPRDVDLLAAADGFVDATEARAFGWSPRDRPSMQRLRTIAPTVTRPEMEALARWYDYLEDVPGFEYIERGASRFVHALADVGTFRRRFSRNLKTPVNPARIYEFFDFEDDPADEKAHD